MATIHFLLILLGLQIIEGTEYVCFKPPTINIETNPDYIDLHLNCTSLSPVTVYVTFNTSKTINHPNVKVLVWNEYKDTEKVYVDTDVDVCEGRKMVEGGFFFHYFIGRVISTMKINVCPLPKGRYKLQKLVFGTSTWNPSYSFGVTNLNISVFTRKGVKKEWFASVVFKIESYKNSAGNACPKLPTDQPLV